MFNHKLYKKFTAVSLAIVLAAAISGYPANAVITNHKTAATILQNEAEKVNTDSTADSADKEETVYVNTDATGGVKQITVSDCLKNKDKSDTIKDASDLSDIENVKGEESYTGSDSDMQWQANGKEITYQGTTTNELPVDVNISYELDGQSITPEELAGKSGKVTIRFDYNNKEKRTITVDNKEYDVYVPFTILSGMVLDGKKFSNICVDNGKVVSEGDKTVVVGTAMPGLAESLHLDEVEQLSKVNIPDYVQVTADVKNFSLDMTLSVIMSDLASELNTDDVSSFDDLENDLNTLSDSSKKLVDGTKDLLDGANTLDEKFGEYADGVKTLVKGIKSVEKGSNSLYSGAKQLNKGAKKLNKGATTLKNGAKTLNEGTKSLKDGSSQLKTGASSLDAGLDTFKKTFDEGIATSKTNTSDYITKTTSAKVAKALEDAVTTASTTASTVTTQALTQSICTQLTSATTKQTVAGGISLGVNSMLDGIIANAKATLAKLPADTTGLPEAQAAQINAAKTQCQTVIQSVTVTKQLLNETAVPNTDYANIYTKLGNDIPTSISQSVQQNVAAASDPKSEEYKTMSGTITKAVDAAVSKQANTDVTNALTDLGTFLTNQTDASQKSVDAALTLSDDYQKDPTKTVTLKDGTNALINGTNALSTGATELSKGSTTLYNGTKTLSSGTKSLYSGSQSLTAGIEQLKKGSVALQTGGAKINTATDALSDGIGTLAKGAKDLHDGMVKFDNEGIQEIVSMVNGDLKTTLNRVKAVKDAGETYHSFTKLANGQSGNVKFILESEAIKKEKEK